MLLFNIDHTSLFSSHEKEVYDNLVRVVGCEMDIRIRQTMLLITDKIRNKVNTNITTVSSGSLAEGSNLPGSDIDITRILNDVQVIQNGKHMHRSARYTNLLMVYDMEFPGFSRLKYIPNSDHEDGHIFTPGECFVETTNGMYLSNISFIRKLIEVNIDCKHTYMILACLTKMRTWIWLSAFTCIPGQCKQNNGYIVVDLVSGQ